MKRNVATWDQMARLIVGAALIYLAASGGQATWLAALLGVVGGVLVVTGVAGRCPLYQLTGMCTHRPTSPGQPG